MGWHITEPLGLPACPPWEPEWWGPRELSRERAARVTAGVKKASFDLPLPHFFAYETS